jgi:hypothetical protein
MVPWMYVSVGRPRPPHLLHFSNSFKLSMEQHNVLVSAHTTQCGWQRHCLAGEGSTSWLPAVRD